MGRKINQSFGGDLNTDSIENMLNQLLTMPEDEIKVSKRSSKKNKVKAEIDLKYSVQQNELKAFIKNLSEAFKISDNLAKSLTEVFKQRRSNLAGRWIDLKDQQKAIDLLNKSYEKYNKLTIDNPNKNNAATDFVALGSYIKAVYGDLDFISSEIKTLYDSLYEAKSKTVGEKYDFSVTNFKNLLNVLDEIKAENPAVNIEELMNYLKTFKMVSKEEMDKVQNVLDSIDFKGLMSKTNTELLYFLENIVSKFEDLDDAISKYDKIENIDLLDSLNKQKYTDLQNNIEELKNLQYVVVTLAKLRSIKIDKVQDILGVNNTGNYDDILKVLGRKDTEDISSGQSDLDSIGIDSLKIIKEHAYNIFQKIINSQLDALEKDLLNKDILVKLNKENDPDKYSDFVDQITDYKEQIRKGTIYSYSDFLDNLADIQLISYGDVFKELLGYSFDNIKSENIDDFTKLIEEKYNEINKDVNSNLITVYDQLDIVDKIIKDNNWINYNHQNNGTLTGNGFGTGTGGNGSFNDGEDASESYSEILELLKEIQKVLDNISKSFGQFTDDKEFKPLLTTLKEVTEYFETIRDSIVDISSRDLSPTLNIQANQSGDTYSIRKRAQRYKENYENAFSGIGYTNLFSFLAQSSIAEKYDFSPDKLKKQFGSEAINGIENKEDQIERIVQFFKLIDASIDERAEEIETARKLLEKGVRSQSDLDALINDETYNQLLENQSRRFVSTNQKYINKQNAQSIAQANNSPLSSANKLLDSLNDASIVGKLDEILQVIRNISATLEAKRTRGAGEGTGRNSLVDSFREQILPLYNLISDKAEYNPEKGTWKYSSDATADDLNISAEITKAIKKAREKNVDIAKLFSEDGQDIAEGVAKGIGEGQVDINKELDNIKENSQEYFEKINGIHSPARDWYPIGENLTLGIAEGVRQGYYDLRDAMDYITELAKTEVGRNLIAEDDTQKIDFKNMVSPISELRWEMLKNGYSNEQADETIFNMHEELYKEGINRKSALSTIFNNDEKEKIEEITEALREYYITLKEIDPFATKVNDNGDEFNVVDIGDELRDKLKNGTITEDEIRDIYQEKFQNAFNKLSNLFPNIDADQLGDVLKESNIINAFDSIEDASQHLYMALVNNLDISSVIESGLNKHGFSKLENEVEDVAKQVDSNLENTLNPVGIKVNPIVNPEEFADEVTKALKNVKAQIGAIFVGDTVETVTATTDKKGEATTQTKEELEKVEKASEKVVESQQEVSSSSEKVEKEFKQVAQEANNATVEVNKLNTALTESPVDQFINNGVREHLREQYENPNGTGLIPAPNEFTNRDVEYGFTMKDAEEASEEFAEETKEASKAAVGFKTELNEIGDEVLNLLSTSHRYLTDAEGNVISDGKRSFKGQKESGRIVKKTLVEERDQDGNLTGNLAIAVDEETNYAKIVKEAANAVVELTKAEHALALEQAKENPNEENIKEYTKLIDNLKLKLQAQTDAAREFANSFEFFYNDQQFDSNYMMKMFNRNVDQAALDRITKSNINYNNALEAMEKREAKQIDTVNDKLLQQETRLNNIRATYDQAIAPGVSKPVTIIENLEELNKLYDELQNKINSLKGTNASKDDMREISQMMEAYKLRAKVLKDSNNPTKREMGGQELNVAIQQEIANLDKLIEKSQKYGSVTKDITEELIQQKKILVEENKKEESEKDVGILYDTQNIRKYNDALLKSETIKYRQSEEIYNKELNARKEILKLQHQIDMADAKHANNADEIRAKNEVKIAHKQQELDEITKQRKGHTNQDLRNSVEAELKRIQSGYDQELQIQKSITAEVEKRKSEEDHAKAVINKYEEQLKIEKEIAKLEHQIELDKIKGNDSSLHQYDLDQANERLSQFKKDNIQYTDKDLYQQNKNIIKDLKERYAIEERIAREIKARNESVSEEQERVKETARLYKQLNTDFNKYKALMDLGDTDAADKLRSDIIARQVDLRQGKNYDADKDFALLEKFRRWDTQQQVKANKEKSDSDKQRVKESKDAYKSVEDDINAYIGYLKKEQTAVGEEREEYHRLAEEKRKAGLTALAGLRGTDKFDQSAQDKISRKIKDAKLGIRSDQTKASLKEEENQVESLISEYEDLIKTYADIRKKQIRGTELSDLEVGFLDQYTTIIDVYEKFINEIRDDEKYQKRINDILNERKQSYQDIENLLVKQLGDLKLEEKYTETFRNKWKKLQNDIELFKENVNNGNESEINDQINRLQQRIRDIKLERGTSNSLLASDEDINKQMAVINKTLYDSSSMSRKLRDEFKLLRADYAKLLDSDAPQSALDELNTRLAKLKNELHEAGYYGKSFFTQFKEGIRNRTVQTLATYFSFQDIIRYGREFINTIEQLDTALVDLRKTTSMSTTELDEFYYSSNKIAKQMGVTTQEIIQQAANWSRLGYSTKEASEQMAALSSQFAAISPGMDVGTATDGLVSAMKAFHVEVDNVESEIMDPVNRLGNTMATTNEEIVEMLERSSAAMYAANNSIEETLALESAAVQITRNAESTGTAFRTISMRIRGYDEETEELSEEYENLSGKIADLTKTAKSPGGISLFTDKDKKTFKSTYQLLKDISEIWDELSDKQQAQLLEKLAGKRGGQVLAGILGKENFKEVERAMGEIAQAAGSADAEMEIIRDSVAFKLNELKQTWIGFAQELLQRDDIGKIIDRLIEGSESLQTTIDALSPVVSGLVNILSDLIGVLAKLSEFGDWTIPAIAGVGGAAFIQNKTGILNSIANPEDFDNRMGKAKNWISSKFSKKDVVSDAVENTYDTLEDQLEDMLENALQEQIQRAADADTEIMGNSSEMMENLKDNFGEVNEKIEEFSEIAEDAGKNGDTVLTAITNKLKSIGAILTSPTFWGIVGITAAIYALYKLSKAQGEIFEQANKAREEYKENEKALEDYKTQILDLRSITDDSTKSIEEQQSAREQLLDIQSQLIEQYGIEAGSIDILSNSIERLNLAFDGLSEKSYQEFLNSVNRNDGWSGWWHKLATGELFDSSISNASYIKDQMENAHSELFYDTGLTTKGQNQLVNILNEHGISTKYNEGSGIYGVDVDNLQNYYDTLIEIQTEYRDKQDAISASAYKAIEQEVNRVNDILTEISPVYNQMLEHDVINKNYKDEVEKIESLKQEIKKAQIADDKDAVESLTKQLYEAYNGVLEKAGSDESVKNWFGDFVSEVQTLLDSEEFRLKIYPEIETDESRDFQETKDVIAKSNNEHLFDDEVYSLVNSNASTREIGDKYGADVERVVGYIRRQLKAGVPIDLVIDELEIPNKTIRNLGKEFETAFNKLNEEDKSIILQFSEKEIKDEISVAKNEYRKMLNEFSKEGNVDLTIRPKIDSSIMQSAGWDVEDGSVSTTFKSGEFIWQGDEENGKYVYIHYTPILPDGTVLTPKEMDDYLYNVLEGSDDILGADSKGLVIKVDADVDIPEGEIDAFKNGGQISKGIKDFISKTDNWDNEVHKVEEAYYDVNNSTQFVDKAISNLIRKTKELAEETKEVSFEDTINSLSDLEGQIGNVDNAMSKFFDDEDGNVELSDIKAIQDAFAEIEGFNVDDVADDLNSLISAGNYDEASDSIDRLVSKYIEASGILDTVNNKNKDLIETQLRLMGVTNAQEIVEASLNERSALLAAENEYLAETGEDVAEATYEEIYQFINLQNASEQTEKYLAQVAIEKIAINDNKINTAADCQQLLNLANTAMASAEAISTVKEAQAAIASNSITRQDWGQSVLNQINNGTFDWGFSKNKIELDDVSVPMAKYEGGKATKGAKDASSKGSEASKETFDWIETKIQRLERDITNLGKTADATYKTWAERTVALGQEMEKVNEQISLQETAYNAYMAKAESVGLSAQYKKLVQSGALKIDEITDETLKEQINNYKEWYIMMPQCLVISI